MRIAFSSSDGVLVDRHFGAAEAFYLWDVTPDTASALGRVEPPMQGEEVEGKIATRVELLAGCTLVYTNQIGGPAAAKLVGQHIHPIKIEASTPIVGTIERLQTVLQGRPPPWLRKAMGLAPEERAIEDEE